MSNEQTTKSALPDLKKKTPQKKAAGSASRGLGRGLDALLGDRPSKVEKKEKVTSPASAPVAQAMPSPDSEVPIEFLEANPDQPRKIFSEDALCDLADSIKSRGLLQPILVRPKNNPDPEGALYEIVAGERRWRAAQKAGLHIIPVIIRKLTDEQTAEIALIENVQRVDLSPLEEAEAYHALSRDFKRNQEQIAKAVGKSRSHIANIMRLTTLPVAAKNALSNGEITFGHAKALLGSKSVASHLKECINKGLSVRQLESLVRRDGSPEKGEGKSPSLASKSSSTKDADTRALERDLAEALGLEVTVDHKRGGSGSVIVSYLDLDQLDEVCRRLMGSPV